MSTTGFADVVLALVAPLGAEAAGDELEPRDLAPVVVREEPPWRFDAFVCYWSATVAGDPTVDGDEIDLDGGGEGFSGDPALSGGPILGVSFSF